MKLLITLLLFSMTSYAADVTFEKIKRCLDTPTNAIDWPVSPSKVFIQGPGTGGSLLLLSNTGATLTAGVLNKDELRYIAADPDGKRVHDAISYIFDGQSTGFMDLTNEKPKNSANVDLKTALAKVGEGMTQNSAAALAKIDKILKDLDSRVRTPLQDNVGFVKIDEVEAIKHAVETENDRLSNCGALGDPKINEAVLNQRRINAKYLEKIKALENESKTFSACLTKAKDDGGPEKVSPKGKR